MKKILDYFSIDGAVGGNQEWFKNVVMYIGGCAAATACDCGVYLALRRGMTHLYPYNVHALTKQDYIDFSMKMKPYLRPRVNGVNKLWMFTEGFGNYLKDIGENGLKMKELPGTEELRTAELFIRQQIDNGYPVPYLMLRHRKAYYKDFVWHWFLCYGYEERKDGVWITGGRNLTTEMSHITIGLVITNQIILYAIRPQGCCVPVTRTQHRPERRSAVLA